MTRVTGRLQGQDIGCPIPRGPPGPLLCVSGSGRILSTLDGFSIPKYQPWPKVVPPAASRPSSHWPPPARDPGVWGSLPCPGLHVPHLILPGTPPMTTPRLRWPKGPWPQHLHPPCSDVNLTEGESSQWLHPRPLADRQPCPLPRGAHTRRPLAVSASPPVRYSTQTSLPWPHQLPPPLPTSPPPSPTPALHTRWSTY